MSIPRAIVTRIIPAKMLMLPNIGIYTQPEATAIERETAAEIITLVNLR